MFKKLNKKGFTLAELLIVVAIIGVLVAISIPIFTSQLEKSKEATDMANLRAAYAEGVADLLQGKVGNADIDYSTTYYYNTTTGKIDSTGNNAGKGSATVVETGDNAYAAFKGTSTTGGMAYAGGDVVNKKITVNFTAPTSTAEGFVYVTFAS